MESPTITEIINYNGTPLKVEYAVTDCGDILISEIWVADIEMLVLLDDNVIRAISNQIAKARG